MSNSTFSVAILSGKGGVGKSNIALNVCYGLHLSGHSVLLMDCDMGLGNMDVLLGIAPEHHMQDILLNNMDPHDIILPIGTTDQTPFDLLPANLGMAGLAELDASAMDLLRTSINPLADDYQFLMLDIGAGISPTALGFGAMATMRLLIVTPEPTSLTDGYALMKVMAAKHDISDFHILVNQVDSAQEGQKTYTRLSSVCERFLGFSPQYLGHVRTDQQLPLAVRKQKPLMQLAPHSPAAQDCIQLVKQLSNARLKSLPVPADAQPLKKVTYV